MMKEGKIEIKNNIKERENNIKKAFDTLQWDFLFHTMSLMGFPEEFIQWVKLGVKTAHFPINLNGSLVDYFQSEKGT